MRAILLLLSISAYLSAGGKYIQQATSKPISVIDNYNNSGFYLGFGLSKFKLKNRDFNEQFKSNSATIIAGYNINDYLALEARYNRGLTNLTYYSANSKKKINSKYSNLSIFAKLQYPLDNFNPYILLGYGFNKITNLSNATRETSGIVYGAGISYKLNKKVSIFADYTIVHNKKGFDGRAKQDRIKANLITVGATNKF